jgi:hypothetical protein
MNLRAGRRRRMEWALTRTIKGRTNNDLDTRSVRYDWSMGLAR